MVLRGSGCVVRCIRLRSAYGSAVLVVTAPLPHSTGANAGRSFRPVSSERVHHDVPCSPAQVVALRRVVRFRRREAPGTGILRSWACDGGDCRWRGGTAEGGEAVRGRSARGTGALAPIGEQGQVGGGLVVRKGRHGGCPIYRVERGGRERPLMAVPPGPAVEAPELHLAQPLLELRRRDLQSTRRFPETNEPFDHRC